MEDDLESTEIAEPPTYLERFAHLLTSIDESYFLYGRDLDDIFLPIKARHLKRAQERIDKETLDEFQASAVLYKAKKMARIEAMEYCQDNNILSPIEVKEVQTTLDLFFSLLSDGTPKYNIEDHRVFLIVKSVISHQLSALRLARVSLDKGIVQRICDKEGNETFVINPAEQVKLKFDEAIVDAIFKLDKILEGSKINLEVTEVLSFNDVLLEVQKEITEEEKEKKLESIG